MICGLFEVDEAPLIQALERAPRGSRPRVLVTAPDGLKALYPCLAGLLKRHGVAEFALSASPSFGACDVPVEEAAAYSPDIVAHVGHLPYPLAEAGFQWQIVYVPAYFSARLPEGSLARVLGEVERRGWRAVGIASTATELRAAEQVARYLESRGVGVAFLGAKSVVLGCEYSALPLLKRAGADGILVVAGGRFHALGASLLFEGVLAYDPYADRLWDPSSEASKVLAKRHFLVSSVRHGTARRAVVIAGARPGQYRPSVVSLVGKLLDEMGVEHELAIVAYLTLERLIALDNALGADFYVVTSCPRLPIDDLADFYKPVLTPGEVLMAARGAEKYVFPW